MHNTTQEFQETFAILQKAAEDVWKLLDGFSCSFVVSAEETNDPVKAMKGARDAHASAVEICSTLYPFTTFWLLRTRSFTEKTRELKLDADRTARNRGLCRLPNELLLDILDRAVDPFKSSVRVSPLKSSVLLSHVCKRFRQTLAASSKHWTGHTLDSNFPPSIILGLVERCGHGQFKASMEFNDRVKPTSDSVQAIVDTAARVADLTISDMRYSLNPWQHISRPRLLNCGCLPHPSLSRNLVVCTISVLLHPPSLSHLLEFLSSADKLEILSLRISDAFCDQANAVTLPPISLPNLAMLRLDAYNESIEGYRHFIEKIVPFTASSLALDYSANENSDEDSDEDLDSDYDGDFDIGPFVDLIYAKPSIRDLRVSLARGIALPSIPRYIETLELSGWHVQETVKMWLRCPELFPAQNLRLLKLQACYVDSSDILDLRDLFVGTGRDMVRFQFKSCIRMEDGTYELPDVQKAVGD